MKEKFCFFFIAQQTPVFTECAVLHESSSLFTVLKLINKCKSLISLIIPQCGYGTKIKHSERERECV